MISCSSQDTEFNSLLKYIQKNYPYKNLNTLREIECPIKEGYIKILKGGYPINFDNYGKSVPFKYIQLTRGLLLGVVIQATTQLMKNYTFAPQIEMLHPKIQQLVVQTLLNNLKETIDINNILLPYVNSIRNFLNEEFLKENSRGQYIDNNIINNIFS